MKALASVLEDNIRTIKEIFHNDNTLKCRKFQNLNSQQKFCIFFIEGMVEDNIINDDILKPIMNMECKKSLSSIDYIQYRIISSNNVKETQDLDDIVESLIEGDTILLADGIIHSLLISAKGWQTRPISEPPIEKVVRGPREGFTESLIVNLTLVRRRLKAKDLKFEYKILGTKTATKACVCYLDGIVDKKILSEINKRIDNIKIDGVLDIKYVQELIDDKPFSIFEVTGSTEKPDIVASKLLEGRIAIFLDGTSSVMTVPYLFIEYFQSPEDHYTNYYFASIGRMLRIWAFILTTGIPAVYLSLVTYHKEIIPTPLLLSIFAARQGVPFPTIVELIGLLLVFEILREAGSRMPTAIGQSLSIVGALVLGTAAVDARLVSSPMIIIVGISGITGLTIPSLSGPFIIIRTLFLLFSATFGLYGYVFGMCGLLIHLFNLKSYSVPYMATINSVYPKDLKDTAFRAPRWLLEKYFMGRNKR